MNMEKIHDINYFKPDIAWFLLRMPLQALVGLTRDGSRGGGAHTSTFFFLKGGLLGSGLLKMYKKPFCYIQI